VIKLAKQGQYIDSRTQKLIEGITGIKSSGHQTEGVKVRCPATMRNKIRKRWWGDKIVGSCFCCGRSSLHFEDAQVGRIKAGASGGKYTPDNCRLICGECNRGMSKTNMKVYMKRNFPERYKRLFPKTETKGHGRGGRKPRPKPTGILELPKIEMPKFKF
jgi:hypothetical protein